MFPNHETREFLALNPSEQRDLYRSPADRSVPGRDKPKPVTIELFPNWEEREKDYQKWLGKRSESGNF